MIIRILQARQSGHISISCLVATTGAFTGMLRRLGGLALAITQQTELSISGGGIQTMLSAMTQMEGRFAPQRLGISHRIF